MTDLPEPEPAGAQAGSGSGRGWPPPWDSGPVYRYRRGPRLLPLALLLLFLFLILPGGGWIFFGIFKILLLLWLFACIVGVFAAFKIRRRIRRHLHSDWGGPFRGGPFGGQFRGGPFWGGGAWGESTRSQRWHDDSDD